MASREHKIIEGTQLTSPTSIYQLEDGVSAKSASILRRDSNATDEQRPLFLVDQQVSDHQFGVPSTKPLLSTNHVAACCLSLICAIVAVVCVGNEIVSWHLGVDNRQLIVLGFLLSIMNLCLGTVSPFLLLLIEARFGRSTLQNYSGLLRNQLTRPQMTLYWRITLFMLLALPIALSAAYKSFSGGSSSRSLNTTSFVADQPYYGMFAAPGLQQIDNIGTKLFNNATLPFYIETSPKTRDAQRPPLPVGSQAYGFNVLMLSENMTTFLDIPEPSYVVQVQKRLAIGESWNLSADVYGTVATYDESKAPSANLTHFKNICGGTNTQPPGQYWNALDLFVDRIVHFLVPLGSVAGVNDNSLQYVAIIPNEGEGVVYDCEVLAKYAQPFRITRQACHGEWTITRGGIELKAGSCSGKPAEPLSQLQEIITNDALIPAYWYMTPLAQALGPFDVFGESTNDLHWLRPYMATSLAGILWSRIVMLNGAARWFNSSTTLGKYANTTMQQESNRSTIFPNTNHTYEEEGLLYSVNDTATYTRPTLRKSIWLYLVLTLQPFLIVITVLATMTLHSIPIDQDFGMISILSGIDRSCLDSLAGAGLSGKLSREIRLDIQPTTMNRETGRRLEYRLFLSAQGRQANNGRLVPGAFYE